MPLQNRVTPLGDLIAAPARGLVYGNRGCLHDAGGRIRRRWNGTRWIACRLRFRDRHRPALLQPGRYTELFFLDEATALAAGHRPCSECRRADYHHLIDLWRQLHPGDSGAAAVDARLHAERIDPVTRRRRTHEAALDDLPDGAFVLVEGEPHLVLGASLLRWTPAGYAGGLARVPGAPAVLLTPPSLVALLRSRRDGLVPLLHPSAQKKLGFADIANHATPSASR